MFEPIAIIAYSGIFPGAVNDARLLQAILKQEILLTDAKEEQWRIGFPWVMTEPTKEIKDRTWSKRGGYLPALDYLISTEKIMLDQGLLNQLDPLYCWLIFIWKRLEKQLKQSTLEKLQEHPVIVLGNLMYPSASLAKFYEYCWLTENNLTPNFILPHPINRFHSGFPAQLLAMIMNVKPYAAYCIDAACASSLFAIKYACDYLHAGKANLAVAGGVSGCDDLFIHMGFSALNALSKSGQCKPLHQQTDGLIPGEGAGLIVMKRLQDAIENQDTIYGVIRGIGLTNQGKGSGYLIPTEQGQTKAMELAYQTSGIDPASVSWIELHATGTPIGDKTELHSLHQIFKHSLDIGAIKANIGHMITASAMGSLSIVLECFAKKIKHPTAFALENPISILEKMPFHLLSKSVPWEELHGIRRAGINAFGFGGNNAHMIIDEFHEEKPKRKNLGYSPQNKIVVVAMDADFGSLENLNDIIKTFYYQSNTTHIPAINQIALDLSHLHIPPNDLKKALGQQLIVLKLINRILNKISLPSNLTTSVLIGMQCSTEICRHGLRWRIPALFTDISDHIKQWVYQAQQELGAPLTAADVLGCMPNILSNQINRHFDLQGPSCSIASEQVSGIDALEIAIQQLNNNEIDAAIIGAVDMCDEFVQKEAIRRVLNKKSVSDAAIVMLLMREEDAIKHHLPQIAAVNAKLEKIYDNYSESSFRKHINVDQFGYAHAVYGLMYVLFSIVCCAQKILPGEYQFKPKPWVPDDITRKLKFNMDSFISFSRNIEVEETASTHYLDLLPIKKPSIYFFSATDKNELINNLQNLIQTKNENQPIKLAIVAYDKDELLIKVKHVMTLLNQTSLSTISESGIYYAEKPFDGKAIFICPETMTSYPKMGYELAITHHELISKLGIQINELQTLLDNLYDYLEPFELNAHQMEQSTAYLCQLHELYFKEVLHYKILTKLVGYQSKSIENAYNSNVRVFIVLGPDQDDNIKDKIRATLKDKQHWVITCDDKNISSLQQMYYVEAQLIVGGVIRHREI